MISHKYKCIFIHQRKAAGLTIIDSFGIDRSNPERKYFNDGVISGPNNIPWAEKELKYHDYFVFAVVRNPWDRFISGWKYCPTTRDRHILDVLRNPPQLGNSKQEDHDYRHIIRPQIKTLRSEDGSLATDFIIRFENLQEDYNSVCDLIGKPRSILPVHNKTHHDHYTSYYDDESREMIDSLFKDDINTFGYTFD